MGDYRRFDAWSLAGDLSVVRGQRGRATFYSRCGKRAFDFTLSFAGLVILAAPMTVISLAILALDGRPILFRQERVGRLGRLFKIYKFRTMRNGAGSGSSISIAGDSRATHVGRWLRRFKLDELPQLWNVLRGDMSFVGPRPDVPGYLDRLSGADHGALRSPSGRHGSGDPALQAGRENASLNKRLRSFQRRGHLSRKGEAEFDLHGPVFIGDGLGLHRGDDCSRGVATSWNRPLFGSPVCDLRIADE